MGRSIDARLKKLEQKLVPPFKPVRVHFFAAVDLELNRRANNEAVKLVPFAAFLLAS